MLELKVKTAAAIVFFAAIGVYLNSLSGAFISDDNAIIAGNPLVRKPGSLAEIFGSAYWPKNEFAREKQRPGGLYRPLTILSYALNRRLAGSSGTFAYHCVNVALHGTASVLVFLIAELLGFSLEASAIGGLAFAVLPIHTEAVSWIVGRAEVLGASFALLAWLLLHNSSRWIKIAAGLCCYALALLSKESAAPLPAALILGEILQRRRKSFKNLADDRLIVWVLSIGVLILYLAWRRATLGAALITGTPYFTTQPFWIAHLTMARFFVQGWVGPMATGLGLCADYSRPAFPDATVGDLCAWIALVSIIAVLAWVIYSFFKKRSPWSFSVLVFLCFAAPLSNLLVPMEIIGAERIMYLPSIGFCLLIASGWDHMARRTATRPWSEALAAAFLVWWSAGTIYRNRTWQNPANYFAAAAACAPANPRALSGLGMLADQAGKHAEARGLYRQALEHDPRFLQAAYNMGKSYYDEGDWRNAKAWFEILDGQSAADKDALCMLGLISEKEGNASKALNYYARALERDPSYLEARRNAGLLLYKTGRMHQSLEELEKYLQSSPPAQDAREIKLFIENAKAHSN